MGSLYSPYIYRNAVKNPLHFIDRVGEIEEVLEHTIAEQSVSIVGPRKIGKTSLLLHLIHHAQKVEAVTGKKHLYVFLDCQRQPKGNELTMLQWIWDETLKYAQSVKKLPASIGSTDELERVIERLSATLKSVKEFEDAVDELCTAGFSITWLLDEFELMAENSELDTAFFTRLRGWSLAYPVSYVTSSSECLQALNYINNNVLSSSFFNIFHQQHLGFLTRDAAEDLILKQVQSVEFSGYTRDEIEFLFNLAGYHPAFLQLACYYLFQHKMTGQELSTKIFEKVRQQYKDKVLSPIVFNCFTNYRH